MSSLEQRDPVAAIKALEDGIADREAHIRHHRAEVKRHVADVGSMRETLGMVKARHPELVIKDNP